MTQPNKYFPGDAANAEPFSAFAGRTQAEWEAQQRAGVQSHFGVFEVGFNFFRQLVSFIPFIGPEIVDGRFKGILDAIEAIVGTPVTFLGSVIETLGSFLGLNRLDTSTAQNTGDVALSETALIKAQLDGLIIGGAGFSETFDGAQETTLSGYTHVNFGGSGTYGRKDGYGHWFTAFSISQTILLVKDTDVLTSSTQRCAMKIKTRVLHSDRAVWLLARLDATGDDCCFVKVGPNNISYGYMIGGSITTMDTVSPGSTSSGELWEFEVGAPGQPAGTNDWLWVVRRNGSTILNVVDDPTQPTLLDTSHRSIGFAASARNEFGAQVPPPDIEVITWVDI